MIERFSQCFAQFGGGATVWVTCWREEIRNGLAVGCRGSRKQLRERFKKVCLLCRYALTCLDARCLGNRRYGELIRGGCESFGGAACRLPGPYFRGQGEL